MLDGMGRMNHTLQTAKTSRAPTVQKKYILDYQMRAAVFETIRNKQEYRITWIYPDKKKHINILTLVST